MALLESAAYSRDPNKDIEAITQKLLLKNLLTLPSSSTTALLAVEANPLSPPKTAPPSIATNTTESMITKEIKDAQLNLTKILYEPDDKLETEIKDKDHDLLNGHSTPVIDLQMDDDDRLVIDISDDEKKERKKRRKGKTSMPPLDDKITNKFVGSEYKI
jgi:hypothetical protein